MDNSTPDFRRLFHTFSSVLLFLPVPMRFVENSHRMNLRIRYDSPQEGLRQAHITTIVNALTRGKGDVSWISVVFLEYVPPLPRNMIGFAIFGSLGQKKYR